MAHPQRGVRAPRIREWLQVILAAIRSVVWPFGIYTDQGALLGMLSVRISAEAVG